MRVRIPLLGLAIFAAHALLMPPAEADHRPTLLPDGAIVHGDWGLYRPGHIVPFVEGPYFFAAPRFGYGAYFPSNRGDPNAYRRRPPEPPAKPAEPYYRFWGEQSGPVQQPDVTTYAPFDPPEVIYAPRLDARRDRSQRR